MATFCKWVVYLWTGFVTLFWLGVLIKLFEQSESPGQFAGALLFWVLTYAVAWSVISVPALICLRIARDD